MDRIVDVRKIPFRGFVSFVVAMGLLVSPVYAAGSLKVDKVSLTAQKPSFDCRITYPHISGITNEDTQERLNVSLAEEAKIFRTEAEYEAKSSHIKAEMGFKVTRNQSGVMSLVTKQNISSGNAVTAAQTGMTIDTVTGRRYLISDIFIDNADYVSTLSVQVKSQIERSRPCTKQVKKFEEISENADYYLTADSLVLFFPQGKYWDSECAVKEFSIPLKSLEEILRPQFVVTEGYL